MDSTKQSFIEKSLDPNTQMTPEIAKNKCKNFLITLLKSADSLPPHVNICVKNLIQGLIDNKINPEMFTTQLQRGLRSSPQPCLIPFLRKSMPYLREALKNGEFAMEFYIEGIIPPSNPVTSKTPEAPTNPSVSETEGMFKHKFKNFFEWLLKETNEKRPDVASNIRKIFQQLMEKKIDAMTFTIKIEEACNLMPLNNNGYFVPFLRFNLPTMQKLCVTGELSIGEIAPLAKNISSTVTGSSNAETDKPKSGPSIEVEKQSETDWKVAMSAIEEENKTLKTSFNELKAEMNCLKNIVHELKGLVQKQQENGPNNDNQNPSNDDNFDNPFSFENPPEWKKIKLEPDDTSSEEIQNMKNEHFQASDEAIEKVKIKEEKKDVYVCETCHKTFFDSDDLKRHIETIHCENKKPFQCKTCQATFSRKGVLKMHIEVIHNTCDTCFKVFPESKSLKNHIKNIHQHSGPFK